MPSGFLTSTYTGAGRITKDEYGVTYTYDPNTGELVSEDFPGNGLNPDFSYTYDRMGRRTTATTLGRNSYDSITYNYDLANQVTSTAYTGGDLDGISVRTYTDSLNRRSSVEFWGYPTTSWPKTHYNYDPDTGRLDNITQNGDTILFDYETHSDLTQTVTYQNGGNTRLTTSKSYDGLNRLRSISHQGSGATMPHSFSYR